MSETVKTAGKRLTPAQKRALAKLAEGKSSAYRLGVSVTTLWNLELRNLVRPHGGLGSMAFPRSMDWSITEAGRAALSLANKDT